MSNDADHVVHVAMLPSAGMGHLTPCLRLAAIFLRYNCRVSLITPRPTVSLAESDTISRFCNAFPQVNQIDLPTTVNSTAVNSTDPFWLHFEAIRRSAHLVSSLLASLSSPPSAFILDVSLISPLIPVLESLSLPSYIYFISSARMFSFFAHLSVLSSSHPGNAHPACFIGDAVEIPGLTPIPRSSIPPLLLEPNSLFEKIFMEDSPKLRNLHGILINTFEQIEPETIAVLNDGGVADGLPPVHAVGPLMPCEFEKTEIQVRSKSSPLMKWLDDQPAGSVVYVCFGNRTETKWEQIKEMADGLMKSGHRFLWVVKLKKVDREEEEELEEVFGHELMEKMKVKGLVVKTWVDQNEILAHPAVGGFVNHGGWNSIIEAIWHGVPILCWAQNGDQKISSEAVQISGVGIWPEEWGWGWEKLVKGEDFAKAIKEMMSNESLKIRASELKEEARKVASAGGSIERLIDQWEKNTVKSI